MRRLNPQLLLAIGLWACACSRASSLAPADAASVALPGPDAGAVDAAAPPAPIVAKGFAQRFVDFVKKADSTAPIKATGDLEVKIADKPTARLDALLKDCQAAPADCDGAMNMFLMALAREEEQPKLEPKALTVSLLPTASAKDRQLLVRPFVGPLSQVLMLTSPDTVVPVTEKDLKTLKLTEAAAWTRSLANLRTAVKEPIEGKPFVDDTPSVRVGQFTTAYGGGRFILHERWEAIAKAAGGDLHVAVPSRETIVWVAKPDPREANALRWLAQTMVEHEFHPLAPTIFRWTAKGWEVEDKNEEPIEPADK